jgi:hypothetical protein
MMLSNIRSDMCKRRKRGSDLTLNTIPFNYRGLHYYKGQIDKEL